MTARISSRLIGRSRELADLVEAHAISSSGQRAALFVSGEPGIGKTRLLEDFTAQARDRGSLVLRGGCYEDAASLAFGPFVEILRQLAHHREGMDPGPTPDLASVLPACEEPVAETGQTLPDQLDRNERMRLFDRVARLLQDAAREQPLTLLLDDLHWADEPSSLLLRYVVRSLPNAPILVVGAYRDTDLDADSPFEGALRDLQRERLARRISLRRLNRAETEGVVAALLDASPAEVDQGVIDTIQHESEGVPFFIEELVLHLREMGMLAQDPTRRWRLAGEAHDTIPQSVRSVVGHRLGHLPPDAQQALAVGAVIGKEFSFGLLLDVLRERGWEDDDALLEAIDVAVARRLLVEHRPGAETRFGFAHEQIQSVLYRGINPIRRRAFHQLVGEVIERRAPDTRRLAPWLARHFSLGEDLSRAIHYLIVAAEDAAQFRAFERAIRYYDDALEIFDLLGQRNSEPYFSVLLARDPLHENASLVEEQSAGIQAMLAAAEEMDRDDWRLEAHIRAARFNVRGGNLELAREHGDRAIHLAEPMDDRARMRAALSRSQAAIGRLLGEPSRLYRPNDDLIVAAQRLTAAREIAERQGWRNAAGWTTQDLGVVLWALAPSDDAEARARARSFFLDALEQFREAGNRKGEITALIALAYRRPISASNPSGPLQGSFVGFLEEIRRLRKNEHLLSRESDRPRLEALTRMSIHTYARTRGWYEVALERATEALDWASSSGDLRVTFRARLGLAETELRIGRPARAFDHASRASAVLDAAIVAGSLPAALKAESLGALTAAYLALGNPQRAVTIARQRLEIARQNQLRPRLAEATTGLAEALLALPDGSDEAREMAQEALSLTANLPGSITWDIRSYLVLCEIALRSDDANSAFEHAAAATSRVEARETSIVWLVTQAFLAQGRALEALNDLNSARPWFERAYELVEEIATHFASDELRETFLRDGTGVAAVREAAAQHGISTVPNEPARSNCRPGGLTPRELEILALVAAGRTNREISDQLFISDKTVARHLTNTFAKINVESRTQAAAWAFRNGLA